MIICLKGVLFHTIDSFVFLKINPKLSPKAKPIVCVFLFRLCHYLALTGDMSLSGLDLLHKKTTLTFTGWVDRKKTQLFVSLLCCSSWIHCCYSNTPHDEVYQIALRRTRGGEGTQLLAQGKGCTGVSAGELGKVKCSSSQHMLCTAEGRGVWRC